MELNKEEQTKIKEFIKDYKSIESNINLIIGEIKSLDKQKDIRPAMLMRLALLAAEVDSDSRRAFDLAKIAA